MKKLDLKQKKTIFIILIILAVVTYYYFYIKENSTVENNQNLEINNSQENEKSQSEKEKTNEKIIVHVSGAVNNEGIVELETNSRIANAIEKAGGVKENADMTNINLAYPLEDGMKIYIPTIEETQNKNSNDNKIIENCVTSSSGGINTKEDSNLEQNNNTSSITNKKVNINTASTEELDTLPGIGPSIASKIVEYREQNGKFNSIEEIKEVSGIGDAKYENIKDLISIK